MIDFIKTKNQYKTLNLKFYSIFKHNKEIEKNPFNANFKYFLAFDFDFIYDELFFDGIKKFLMKINEKDVVFYTISPSPEKYFFKHFKKYSIFKIDLLTSDTEINDIMMKDPGGSPADAIALNSDDIALFSDSNDWAILASRDWEIGIVGFSDLKLKNLFLSSFGSDANIFSTIGERVKILKEILNFNEVDLNNYNQLIESYKIRPTHDSIAIKNK